MYSLAHARVNSRAMVFMSAWTAVIHNSFCMFLIVMQWICHCVQWYIDSVGVFVWALAPFFGFCCVFCCLLRCFRWRNASLAGGFAGRRFLFGCGFRFCCFNRFADSKDPLSLYSVFSAYSHVRTEPLARHRPHSREKKADIGTNTTVVRSPYGPTYRIRSFHHAATIGQ